MVSITFDITLSDGVQQISINVLDDVHQICLSDGVQQKSFCKEMNYMSGNMRLYNHVHADQQVKYNYSIQQTKRQWVGHNIPNSYIAQSYTHTQTLLNLAW